MKVSFSFTVKGPHDPVSSSSFSVRFGGINYDKLEAILEKMIQEIADKGFVSIAGLRDITDTGSGLFDTEHEHHWGWTILRTGKILEVENGFLLSLPPAQLIDHVNNK